MDISSHTLKSALQSARDAYTARNPRSREMSMAASEIMPGGNTRTVLYYDPFPLYIKRGEGACLWDVDEHRYINFLGEFTAGIFGHSHPVIRDAIHAALERGINLSGQTTGEMRLATLIHERFPSMELMRFTNSGTEANLMAISATRLVTKREAVMVFSGAYHGGVLSFGRHSGPINAPFHYVVGRYNDIGHATNLIRAHGAELACVLVEPMMGSGGCIPASLEFLTMLRKETQNCGAALVFDEVMTSRLSMGGAQGLYGIKPDMTTLGKYLGGGMSFGAFGGARRFMEPFDPSKPDAVAHAGTFNNNVLTMAAGAAALEKILTKEVMSELNKKGDRLRDSLNSLFSDENVPLQATGIGSLVNIHAVKGDIRCVEDLAAGNELIKELFFLDMLESGFYIARRGFMALSIEITDTEINEFLKSAAHFVTRRRATLNL